MSGIPRSPQGDKCFLPRACFGWKSPNGFDYPPSYGAFNLTFENVTGRHFTWLPPFEDNSFKVNITLNNARFCNTQSYNWSATFSSIDRQTSLRDVDGKLTTRQAVAPNTNPILVINNDEMFRSPAWETQCLSLNTSIVMPHHVSRLFVHIEGASGQCANGCEALRVVRLSYIDSGPLDKRETPDSTAYSLSLQGPQGAVSALQVEGTTYLVDILTPRGPYAPLNPAGREFRFQWMYPR